MSCSLVCLLLGPSAARGGEYTVDVCRTPSGERLLGIGGWRSRSTFASQSCTDAAARYPGLGAGWGPAGSSSEFRGWEFAGPAGSSIVGFQLQRWFAGPPGGGVNWIVLAGDALVDSCIPPYCRSLGSPFTSWNAAENRVAAQGFAVSRLRAGLLCAASEGCAPTGSDSPRFNVMAARVRVVEKTPPRFLEAPSGSLLSAGGALTGEKSVSARLADAESGLAATGLKVDGQEYAVQPVDPDDPKCRVPYSDAVPCPLQRRVTLLFDTAVLANGRHTIRVLARDAAGNESVSDPYAVVTRNGSRPNGDNAAAPARLRAWIPARGRRPPRRTIAFSRRASVAGRLSTQAGQPISGAVLDVFRRLDAAGSRWTRVGSVATDHRGRFRSTVGPGPSRDLRIAYRAYTLDPGYAAIAHVKLRVRAGIRFSASPLSVRNGSVITFRGRLRGKPGRGGVTVVIYAVGRRARGGRARVPVEAVRSNRAGRFRFRYRFQQIAGPFHYRFQARMRADRGYPYAPGRSRIVHVSARP